MSLVLFVAAYLIGSVSFALLAADRHGIDLRHAGSGNPGATNVGRVIGRAEGRRVLVLDALKGALPTLLAIAVVGRGPAAVVGVAAVLGHCHPIWHRLEGGKGAATAAGVMLVLSPIAGLAAIVTYLVFKRISRRASVGSLAGTIVGSVLLAHLDDDSLVVASGGAIAALVFWRHHENIVRLLRGTEPRS